MEINDAKNLVNETGNEKKKTVLGAIALVAILAVGIFVAITSGTKSKGKKSESKADTSVSIQQSAAFFEQQSPQQQDAGLSRPDELFEKDTSTPIEAKEQMLEMAERSEEIMNNNEAEKLAKENERLRRELANKGRYSSTPSLPVQAAEYSLPAEYRKRLNKDYQELIAHYRKTPNMAWQIEAGTYQKQITSADRVGAIEEPLKNLYEGAGTYTGTSIQLGAGTRLIAITEQEVNSDHQGMFTAKIIRPFELKGAKLLCESGANVRDRIPVRAMKLIHQGVEYKLSGQVEMKYPGMSGRVFNHVMKRLGPQLVNTVIGAGFLAWTASNTGDEVRIDTRDAIAGPIIQESVGGLQNEVTRLGGDFPNTVVVPGGTQFSFLISEKLEISL